MDAMPGMVGRAAAMAPQPQPPKNRGPPSSSADHNLFHLTSLAARARMPSGVEVEVGIAVDDNAIRWDGHKMDGVN